MTQGFITLDATDLVLAAILMIKPLHEMWFAYDKEEQYDWVQY